MPTVKILRLGGERLIPPPPPKKKKKKKKKVLDHYLHHNRLCYSHYGVFCSFILLIYSSQKVPRSLKFCSALHILVLHMHRKLVFEIWKSNRRGGKKERITGNKKNIKVKNKKSHHYMMTFNTWWLLTLKVLVATYDVQPPLLPAACRDFCCWNSTPQNLTNYCESPNCPSPILTAKQRKFYQRPIF